MRKIFALLTVICAVSAMAETKTLWSCGFEAEEGYQTVKVIEKNDGVRIYEEGQEVNIVFDPRDVMAYPPENETEVAK